MLRITATHLLRMSFLLLLASPLQAEPADTSAQAVVEKTYDFAGIIAASLKQSSLPAEEAREMLLRELFAQFGPDSKLIKREEISPGTFKVWASPAFHESLPLVADWIKQGRKQITIEARILTVAEASLRTIQRQLAQQWEMCDGLEGVTVVELEEPSERNPFRLASLKPKRDPGVEFLTASASIRRTLPARMALLDDDGAKKLLTHQQASPAANILQAPKVTLLPGQHAVIKDTTQRPFVVSVKKLQEGDATAMQPIVKVIEEGLTIEVSATLHKHQVVMDADLKFSQVQEVDTFTFESETPGAGTTVQIPSEMLHRVRIAKAIDQGATILIDPHVYVEKVEKRRFRKPVMRRQYTLVMLTPRVLETETLQRAAGSRQHTTD